MATNDVLLSRSPSRSTTAALAALGRELDAVSDLLLTRGAAAAHPVGDHAVAGHPGRASPSRLLAGKIGDAGAARSCSSRCGSAWSSSRDLQEAMRRVSRTAMFRRAERTGELDDVEDQLFRFARIVDAHRPICR